MSKCVDKINSYVILRPNRALVLTAVFWVLLFTIFVIFAHRIPGTDDFFFQEQIKPFPTLWGWLEHRYNTWSGRYFSEAFIYIFSPLPLVFWKVISVLLYGTLLYYAYITYLLFAKNSTPLQKIICLSIICALPYLMNIYALHDATFWITGGMAYFWVTTFGLVALYPLIHSFSKNKLPKWPYVAGGVLAITVAMSSQEQLGAFLAVTTTLLLGIMAYRYVRKTISSAHFSSLVAYTAVGCFSFFLSISAPGNDARISAETIRWIPDFMSIPVELRINYSVRWFLEAIVNRSGFLLPLSWAGLAVLFWQQKNKTIVSRFVLAGLLTLVAITLLKGYWPFTYLFVFHAQWGIPHFSTLSNLLLVLWVGAISFTIVAPLMLRYQRLGWVISTLFAGSFATTALVTLSPTLYASGWRTLYIPSTLLASIVAVIFCYLMNTNPPKKVNVFIVAPIMFLYIFNYLYLLLLMIL